MKAIFDSETGNLLVLNPSKWAKRKKGEDGAELDYVRELAAEEIEDLETAEVSGKMWRDVDGVLTLVDAPVPVPVSVTRIQLRNVLIEQGIKPQIEAAIAAMPTETQEEQVAKDLMEEWWNHAPTIRRDNARVQAMAVGLGLDDATVDALFIAAALVV